MTHTHTHTVLHKHISVSVVHYFITDGLIGGVLKRRCVKNRGPVQQERAPNTPKSFPAEEKQASSITCLQSMDYISLGGHCERQ